MNDYIREIQQIPLLNQEETLDLIVKSQKGDINARNKLVEHNLRLVITIAKKYNYCNSFSIDDLINIGSFGLMRAIEKYDVTKSNTFSTYAFFHIKASIRNTLDDNSVTVRVPRYITEYLNKEKKYIALMESVYNRVPDISEIAKELGVSEEKLNEFHSYQYKCISIEQPIDSRNGDNLVVVGDFIADEYPNSNPEMALEVKELLNAINESFDELEDPNRRNIAYQYLIEGKKRQDIAKEYNVTFEAVRSRIERAKPVLQKAIAAKSL